MTALCPATWAALEKIAADEACSANDLIRDAVHRDLLRRSRAKKAVRADERLVAPLRALLADDFAYAESWSDLHHRLRRKGYSLIEAGAGLALCEATSGARICKASDLGNSYGRLIRRFGRGLPGHSHGYLPQRLGVNVPNHQ